MSSKKKVEHIFQIGLKISASDSAHCTNKKHFFLILKNLKCVHTYFTFSKIDFFEIFSGRRIFFQHGTSTAMDHAHAWLEIINSRWLCCMQEIIAQLSSYIWSKNSENYSRYGHFPEAGHTCVYQISDFFSKIPLKGDLQGISPQKQG